MDTSNKPAGLRTIRKATQVIMDMIYLLIGALQPWIDYKPQRDRRVELFDAIDVNGWILAVNSGAVVRFPLKSVSRTKRLFFFVLAGVVFLLGAKVLDVGSTTNYHDFHQVFETTPRDTYLTVMLLLKVIGGLFAAVGLLAMYELITSRGWTFFQVKGEFTLDAEDQPVAHEYKVTKHFLKGHWEVDSAYLGNIDVVKKDSDYGEEALRSRNDIRLRVHALDGKTESVFTIHSIPKAALKTADSFLRRLQLQISENRMHLSMEGASFRPTRKSRPQATGAEVVPTHDYVDGYAVPLDDPDEEDEEDGENIPARDDRRWRWRR